MSYFFTILSMGDNFYDFLFASMVDKTLPERGNLLLVNWPQLRRKAKLKLTELLSHASVSIHLNPIALRKTKIAYNFGLSEGSRVKNGPVHFKLPVSQSLK